MPKNYLKVETRLMKAVAPLGDPENDTEALVVYLVGCAVSAIQVRTEERRQHIYGLLSDLVEKNRNAKIKT